MAEAKIGIFRAIFRYLRFWNWKKARGIIKAADEQFTGSVDGISAAFDIQKDKMVSQFTGLRDAIAQVEAVLEDKRSRLEDLNEEEEDLIKKREGALALAEQAKADGDDPEYEKHAHAFERFQVMQERLNVEIKQTSKTMDQYMIQLQDFQAEIEKMPIQKAEAIADFVSAKQIVELNDRLQGLETSIDKGPISAVMEANKKLTAKARISEKLAKADVRVADKAYEAAGRQSTARSKMDQMLSARKLEKEEKSGKSKVKSKEDRPKI